MNNSSLVRQFGRAVFHELFRSRKYYNSLACGLLLLSMVAGYLWQSSYQSEARLRIRSESVLIGSALETFQQKWINSVHQHVHTSFPQVQISDLYNAQIRISHEADTPSNAQAALQQVLNSIIQYIEPTDAFTKLENQTTQLNIDKSHLVQEITRLQQRLRILRKETALLNSKAHSERSGSLSTELQKATVSLRGSEAKIAEIERQLV